MYRLHTTTGFGATGFGATVIAAEGEVDAYAAPELRELLARRYDDGRVVFDLTAVSFMDSTALGLVARGVRELGEAGHEVYVVLPRSTARRIFEITTLDRLLPVRASLRDALAG